MRLSKHKIEYLSDKILKAQKAKPDAKDFGIELPPMTLKEMQPFMSKALTGLKAGQTSAIVEVPEKGFYIFMRVK